MAKVTIVQVVYNNRRFIEPVFSAIFSQTYKDFNVVAVIAGNEDGGKEILMEKFPRVEIIDPGYNIGFAKGHNLVFEKYTSDFFQLVNPDMMMEPEYIENILKAFDDPKVGAATGKLYQWDITMGTIVQLRRPIGVGAPTEASVHNGAHCVLDTTGVTISKSGRARDRGQHETDIGQYDKDISIQAVSAAGAMYRRSALLATRLPSPAGEANGGQPSYKLLTTSEFFDEDFHSYWEDVDLTWRMANAGWKNIFVPAAVGYHGRGAGSSEHGYKDLIGFIRHHKNLSLRIRKLNYQNHIFLYIKNSPHFYPQFFVREFFMFFYVLFFEIGTLKVLPRMFSLLPKMWQKRKFIQFNIIRGHE
jgi:GT2 family glycosyltransferase